MNTHLKPLVPLLALCACFLFCPPARAQGDGPESTPVKLLTIGNSFANNAIKFLPALAEAGDKKLLVGRANIGGSSLERHADAVRAFEADPEDPKGRPYPDPDVFPPSKAKDQPRFSLKQILQKEDWDYITIQQFSLTAADYETYEPHASELVEYIRKHSPGAEILILQTWAYRGDHEIFADGGYTQEAMFQDIEKAYGKLSEAYGLRILPVGAAFQAARAKVPFKFPDPNFNYKHPEPGTKPNERGSLIAGWTVYEKENGQLATSLDAKHANTHGQFLGACVFYRVIFDKAVAGNPFIPKGGMSPEEAGMLQKIADETVAKYSTPD